MRPLVTVVLAACGPANVGGRIDGERVGGARDAFYDRVELETPGGTLELLTLVVTDLPDGCGALGEWLHPAPGDCDDVCDDAVQAAEEFRVARDRYWGLVVTVNVSDGVVGEFDHDPDVEDEEFDAEWLEWDTSPLLDPGDCEDECRDGDLLEPDTEPGDDGLLTIADDGGGEVRGRIEVGFGGDDRLDGGFRARSCDMDEWRLYW